MSAWRCQTLSATPRSTRWTGERLRGMKARVEVKQRISMPHDAIHVAVAPDPNDAAAMRNLPQRDYRLNLRPARARRLSKAGRHWAPITRQRATRKARQSGRTWPTYCRKPNRRRASTAWCALSPGATAVVNEKTNLGTPHLSNARNVRSRRLRCRLNIAMGFSVARDEVGRPFRRESGRSVTTHERARSAKNGSSPILAVTSAVIAPITRWESQLPPGAPPGSTVSSSAQQTPVGLWRSAMRDPTPVTLPLVPSRRSGTWGAFERGVSERLRSAQGLKIPAEGKVRRMRSATCHAAQPTGDQHARQPCLSSP